MNPNTSTSAAETIVPVVVSSPVRPGISEAVLETAGIRRVTSTEAQELIGIPEAGILIPYFTFEGLPLNFSDRAFCRVRSDNPEAKAKYLSPAGSGSQAYFPPGFSTTLGEGKTLHVVEGEFKALALCEAGIPAMAVGGISSTCPNNAEGVPEPLPALAQVIKAKGISEVVFIGDNDTVFIPAFSKEMVKLAKCLPVPLKLLRIPVNAQGKAPDDLIAVLGVNFPAAWQQFQQPLEVVKASDTSSALAWRLLSREVAAIIASEDTQKASYQEGLVKLGAGFTADVLVYANIAGVALKLDVTNAVFNKAVKVKQASLREQQMEEQIQAMIDMPDPTQKIFFDGDHYYRHLEEVWRPVIRTDAQLHLSMQGLSKAGVGGDSSPVDQALYALQQQNRVDYAGKLCGRTAGYWVENNNRILVTDSPKFIEGKLMEYPTISKFLDNLFGVKTDQYGVDQIDLFKSWLKLGRAALRKPKEHLPGQVLGLIGPHDCGKSLIIEHLISPSLGGRSEDATAYFLDKDNFNGNLWEVELLVVGDKGLGESAKDRVILRDNLKKAVAEPIQRMRPIYKGQKSLRPIWRIVLAANDSAENITDLPNLDASFSDKIIYLKCYKAIVPLFCAQILGEREAFTQRMREELQGFLYAVDNYEIPTEFVKGRFGVKEWHHPQILANLETASHLQPIAEIIMEWIKSDFRPDEQTKVLSSMELYNAIAKKHDGRMPANVCSGVYHFARLLSSLSESPSWKGLVQRGERRNGGSVKNQRQTVWTITKPEGPEFEHTGPVNMFAAVMAPVPLTIAKATIPKATLTPATTPKEAE